MALADRYSGGYATTGSDEDTRRETRPEKVRAEYTAETAEMERAARCSFQR